MRRAAAAGAVLLVLLIGAFAAFHDTAFRALLQAAARTQGYPASVRGLHVGWGAARVEGLAVTSASGEPVLSADRIEIAYSLPDLLVGRRRFGVRAVRVEKPFLTLIHRADGSYNLVLPPMPAKAPPNRTPLDVRVRVDDGRVLLVDRYSAARRPRSEVIDGVRLSGLFSTRERSYYDAGFTLEEAGRRYPAWGRAASEAEGGFAAQHWHADALPIAFLVDFALQSHAVSLTEGRLVDLDARAYTFLDAPEQPTRLFASADLQGGVAYALALAKPVRGVHGPLRFAGGIFQTPGLDATLAGAPLHLVGGVYDVPSPGLRFLLTGRGNASALRSVVASMARKPMEGELGFSSLIEGPVTRPLLFVRASSPALAYSGMRVLHPHASIAVSGTQTSLLEGGGSYASVGADALGWLDVRRHVTAKLLARAHARSDDVRYLSTLLSGQRIDALACIVGTDAALSTNGLLWGNGPGGSTRASFRIAGSGVGAIGPLEVRRSDGAFLLGTALLNRPKDVLAAVGSARMPLGGGTLAVRFSAFEHGGKTIVQVSDARFGNARVWGVPVERAAATIGVRKNAVDVYAASLRAAGGVADMRGSFGNGGGLAAVASGVELASLRIPRFPVGAGRLDGALRVSGTRSAPSGSAALSLSHAAYRGEPLGGHASLAYANARMRMEDVSLLFAGAYGDASGEVSDPGQADSRLDLSARVRALELSRIARLAGAKLPYPLRASLDADARIVGRASAPEIAGEVSVPEGSVNGLRFVGASALVSGRPGKFAVRAGRISVGTTQMRFAGAMGASALSLALSAPHVDAADFNDFFDEADMLGGRGSAMVDLTRSGGTVRGSVDATLAGARFRGFQLGATALRVRTVGDEMSGTLNLSGAGGSMLASLRAGLAAPRTVDAAARISGLDLAVWLPAAGFRAPIVGRADAVIRARGPLDAPVVAVQASVRNGLAWRVPVTSLSVALTGDRRRVAVSQAALDVPGLSVRGGGTLGVAADAPFDLALRASSADIRPLAAMASGRKVDVRGRLDVAARLQGTRDRPRSSVQVSLTALRAHAVGVAGTFSGDLSGSVETSGTLRRPLAQGSLALRNAAYASPLLRSPLHNGRLDARFSESSISLAALHLEASGGSLEGSGGASWVNPQDLRGSASGQLVLTARAFRVDAPKYLRGTIDGDLTLRRDPDGPALVGGNLAFISTRIPVTALLPSSSSAPTSALPIPVAFDLGIEAGRDVRVQSANVDVGARGSLLLAGTLAAPTLSGRLEAAGGSLSFYRTFALQSGILAFTPDTGVIPFVSATATTHIANPDTNILLHASGLATNLTIDFASDPSYSREQIVGLLAGAQAFGAVAGVPSSGNATAGQPSLLQSAAVGYVDQQFTRTILEPLQSNLGQALGLQNLQLNAGLSGEYGGTLSKALGGGVTVSFAESYGTIARRSIGLRKSFKRASVAQLAFFSASGAPPIGSIYGLTLDPTRPIDLSLLSELPPAGSTGFTLSYQHRFW